MSQLPPGPCTAFEGGRRLASGSLADLTRLLAPRLRKGEGGGILVFEDATGTVLDLDLREGLPEPCAVREPEPPEAPGGGEPRGRGRPRLGVVPREVTLLPRHWEWLNRQPGGASVTLRRLVEAALREGGARERVRRSQEAAYRFMAALAGNEGGFEEALRALYAGDGEAFRAWTAPWPEDVRAFALRLAGPALGEGEPEGEMA